MLDLHRGTPATTPRRSAASATPEKRDNEDFVVKGTYFLSTKGLGSHNIVLGYEDFTGKRKSNNYQSGSNYRRQHGRRHHPGPGRLPGHRHGSTYLDCTGRSRAPRAPTSGPTPSS